MVSTGAPVFAYSSRYFGLSNTWRDVFSSSAKRSGNFSITSVWIAHERDDERSGNLVPKTLLTGGALSLYVASAFSSLNTASTFILSRWATTPAIGSAPQSASPFSTATMVGLPPPYGTRL